jgi:hypothetical protein
MTKLPETSETSIAITFLVVNLCRLLRQFLWLFLSFLITFRTKELKKRFYFKKSYVNNNFNSVELINERVNNWHLTASFLKILFQQTLCSS